MSGASVGTQGGDIVVQIPGVKNGRTVLKTIGQTAQLLFRPVLCYGPRVQRVDRQGDQGGRPRQAPAAAHLVRAQYQLTAANLNINTSTGQPSNNIAARPGVRRLPVDARHR